MTDILRSACRCGAIDYEALLLIRRDVAKTIRPVVVTTSAATLRPMQKKTLRRENQSARSEGRHVRFSDALFPDDFGVRSMTKRRAVSLSLSRLIVQLPH